MVNDLKQLLHDNVASPPPEHLDLDGLVRQGRSRVRRRRGASVGVAAVAAAVAVGLAVAGGSGSDVGDRAGPATHPPAPDAPTLRLSDARQAAEGRDYDELTSYTNHNLNRDNGQYLDGVTEDGLVLFRDGPRMDQLYPRFALMDPATGAKQWLPRLRGVGQDQTWPVHLGADRLVLVSLHGGVRGELEAHVFDRSADRWSTVAWPDLPAVDFPRVVTGPDGRLYVLVPATHGEPPPGGWPTGPDGEADDADAEGDTFDLWSVSLTDPADARDEGMSVGALAFTDTAMVWTDSSNGAAGMVHVRDLASGTEHEFDPHTGEKCNLLSFGASGERIVMSQYCGTYARGVRDDRVQVLSTDGEQVVTLQDSGLDGGLPAGSDVVNVQVYDRKTGGTYLYDLRTDRFWRVSDAISNYVLGGPTGDDRQFMWHTPVNHRRGSTQHIGVLRP